MAENSAIQWLTRGDVKGNTWNPWISCQHATYIGYDGKEHVHPGCLHCYAEDLMDTRYGKCAWGSTGNRVKTSDDYWKKPGRWNKAAAKAGVRVPVFPSLCDPFEAWEGPIVNHAGEELDALSVDTYSAMSAERLTMSDLRCEMFGLIDSTLQLDWILFTKRPGNVRKMWPCRMCGGTGEGRVHSKLRRNVTLCYSASNQETLDYGAPLLLQCADLCPTIGLSLEPLLGLIDPYLILRSGRISWVIIGCESNGPRVGRLGVPSMTGPGGKMVTIDTEERWWRECARVVLLCSRQSVPCFVKQGPRNGRVVHDPQYFPADCRDREFPPTRA